MIKDEINKQGKNAKIASKLLKETSIIERNNALKKMIEYLLKNEKEILFENQKDIKFALENNMQKVLIDRLSLSKLRINLMINTLKKIITLDDPINSVVRAWNGADGIEIKTIKVPLGVIGIIFESRPNVIIDVCGLTIKTGNSIILKGSSSAKYSNKILCEVLRDAINSIGFYKDSIQIIDSQKREAVDFMMKMDNYLDVLIPRGGKDLIENVKKNSLVPVIETGIGICHCYIDDKCDLEKAIKIVINGKIQRPSVCNSLETLLIHKNSIEEIAPYIDKIFIEKKVEIRACEKAYKFFSNPKMANINDFKTEFLDYIINIKIVENIEEAIKHINSFGSKHSDVIITNDYYNARIFQNKIESSCVYVNASTRFSDGEIFGFGAEIGISTQKIHARGPMGVDSLMTVKHLINGDGQIRE